MSTEAPPAAEQRSGRAGTWAVLRPLVLRLHFYAGLFVGPFLLVAALTGGRWAQIAGPTLAPLSRATPGAAASR